MANEAYKANAYANVAKAKREWPERGGEVDDSKRVWPMRCVRKALLAAKAGKKGNEEENDANGRPLIR